MDIMERSFNEVVRCSDSHGVNNRIAAYMLAMTRGLRAEAARNLRLGD